MPFNPNGGLTLVPMPGFVGLAEEIKEEITNNISTRKKTFETKVDITKPEFGERCNGEPYIRMGKEHIGGHDCVILTSGPGTYKMLMQTYLLLKYLAGRRAGRILLVTGYLPLSRSDKDEGHVELALLPMVIDLFLTAGKQEKGQNQKLDRIICFDLHSPQGVMAGGPGLITEVSMIRRVLKHALQDALHVSDRICLSFPDDSAQKREFVGEAIDKMHEEFGRKFPEVYGAKRRTDSHSSSQKHVFGDIEEVQESIVICLDDEVATGGTNIGNAEFLKQELGAKEVWPVVTHGVLCGAASRKLGDKSCAVDTLYMTDTIPVHNREQIHQLVHMGKIKITKTAPDLAWMIYNHHWDISVRELR